VSVIVTVTVAGNPGLLEAHAEAHPEAMRAIADRAARHGVIAHRFYGADGRIMLIDEWPDEQSFQAFFAEGGPEIETIMAAAAISSEPEVAFWRKLETRDEIGWDA
jgi:quinol monooxygenase YgiN